MTQHYEFEVHDMPADRPGLQRLLNDRGMDGFDLVSLSYEQGVVLFQRTLFTDYRSEEHINAVLTAVKSYDDVKDLEFVLIADDSSSDDDSFPRVLSDDEAWRFLINRILGES